MSCTNQRISDTPSILVDKLRRKRIYEWINPNRAKIFSYLIHAGVIEGQSKKQMIKL